MPKVNEQKNGENRPTVSIIMNCKNGERFLESAIRSVYEQTFDDWELIFWDNVSTDDSATIAQSFDSRVKYHLSDTNECLGDARRQALKRACGKYVTFLDTDDLYPRDRLSIQVASMEAHGAVFSYGGVEIIDSVGKPLRQLIPRNQSGDLLACLLKKYEVNMQTVMISRDLVTADEYQIDAGLGYSPDYNLFMKIAKDHPLQVEKKILAKYRVYPQSLSRQKLRDVAVEMKITLDHISKSASVTPACAKALKYAYCKLHYYDAIFLVSDRRYKDALAELTKIKFRSLQFFVSYFLVLCRLPPNLLLRIWRR